MACGCSFFLCLMLCVLWVRSFSLADYVTLTSGSTCRDLYAELGSLQYSREVGAEGNAIRWTYEGIRDPYDHYRMNPPGGLWGQWAWDHERDYFHWSFPFWILVLVAASAPAVWIYKRGMPGWGRLVFPSMIALWPVEVVILAPALGWEADRGGGVFAVALCLWAAAVAVPVLIMRDGIMRRIRRRIKPWPWQFRAVKRYRRYVQGLCMECGYDVRASGRVCPECGTPIAGRAGEDLSYVEPGRS
jgi:hypothetical protein